MKEIIALISKLTGAVLHGVFAVVITLTFIAPAGAQSMFDDNGSYSGEWKQMTNVTGGAGVRYSSSNYTSSAWYANNNKQRKQNVQASAAAKSSNKMDTMPFRYNTLNYTRVRKVKGGYGDYNSKCTDIGDASFCQ